MNLINDTAVIENVFPVNPGEIFNGQTLKADEIICEPNATLTFTNISVPFWVIYCEKLKLKNNSLPVRVELDQTIKGKNGENGLAGVNGVGEIDRQGQPGIAGQAGLTGDLGESLKNPDLYIIVKEIICIDTLQNIEDSKFVLDFDGLSEGDGGNGGNGGDGSKGSDIYFVLTEIFTEVFVNTTKFYIRGGNGGIGGNSGKPGYAVMEGLEMDGVGEVRMEPMEVILNQEH